LFLFPSGLEYQRRPDGGISAGLVGCSDRQQLISGRFQNVMIARVRLSKLFSSAMAMGDLCGVGRAFSLKFQKSCAGNVFDLAAESARKSDTPPLPVLLDIATNQ